MPNAHEGMARPLWLLRGLSGVLLAGFGLGVLPPGAEAQVAGYGRLKGIGALAVQRCGQAPLHTAAQVVVASDGTWSATSNDGAAFTGTSVPAGGSGRKLALSFDASSEAGFIASMAGDAAELCHTSIEVTSVLKKKFVLTVNRRATRAKLVLRYTATGIGGGRSGKARSGFTLQGRWTSS
jgi:hypothetical protein